MIEQPLPARKIALQNEGILLWQAYLLVFISSSSGLILEMIASRIMAPFAGTSIYTWTSVIGVALAGISFGNWLGGRLADRSASFQLLRRLYYVGGLTSLLIIPLTLPVMGSDPINGLPLQLRVLVSAALLFFVPCSVFGTISPVVIKLSLKDLTTAGGKVGSIYAVSTLGSIVGTFATGFFLISFFGTTMIVWLISLLMLLTGAILCLLFSSEGRLNRQYFIEVGLVLVIFIAISAPNFLSGRINGFCFKETDYYCIRVQDGVTPDGRPAKAMMLDLLIHNFIVPDLAGLGGYGYEQVYGDVAKWMNRQNEKIDLLVIGAGAFSFPRFIRSNFPDSSATALEIDPEVVEVAHDQFALSRNTDINIFTEDARTYMNRKDIAGKYSLVQGDAFLDVTPPYHLTTYEFNERVKNAMSSNGIYMVNLIDIGAYGDYLRSMLFTLHHSYKNIAVYVPGGDLYTPDRQTFVVVASNREDTYPETPNWKLFTYPELQEYLSKGKAIMLTDDYVPVDNLLLPVVNKELDRSKH
jgi:spermidine synthase